MQMSELSGRDHGRGLAQNLAQTLHRVVLIDIAPEILERARARILKNVKFAALFDPVLREVSESAILDQIEFTTDYERLSDVDSLSKTAPKAGP